MPSITKAHHAGLVACSVRTEPPPVTARIGSDEGVGRCA